MQSFADLWYQSKDGLRLYARDYGNSTAEIAVVCLPGLTRNAKDFAPLCELLRVDFRVLAVDLRGRGRSAYDPDPQNYHPGTYVEDIQQLRRQLGGQDLVFIGTSLGGLVAMLAAAMAPTGIRGLIINDIGPEVNPAGLERIRSYITESRPPCDWQEAVARTSAQLAPAYPAFQQKEWEALADCLYIEDEQGLRLNYDPAIAVLFEKSEAGVALPDMWPMFAMLSALPMLVVRGELSDILLPETLTKMRRNHPALTCIEVAQVGHAPLLSEPQVLAGIRAFFRGIR
ncbi:MAG: alpha/beta hydrolase [Cellvibrionales bacterium]|nr:alpha/beta hydrolase [Cellvibrionales bacterium]